MAGSTKASKETVESTPAADEPEVLVSTPEAIVQADVEEVEAPDDERVAPDEAPEATIAIEFKGEKPYGREFIGRRVLTKADLKKIGIEHGTDLVFSPENGWRQEIPSSNTLLVEYFDKTDSGFKVL